MNSFLVKNLMTDIIILSKGLFRKKGFSDHFLCKFCEKLKHAKENITNGNNDVYLYILYFNYKIISRKYCSFKIHHDHILQKRLKYFKNQLNTGILDKPDPDLYFDPNLQKKRTQDL